jgi:protein-S-isoprenylcysteine O-methyltransferase Ste14
MPDTIPSQEAIGSSSNAAAHAGPARRRSLWRQRLQGKHLGPLAIALVVAFFARPSGWSLALGLPLVGLGEALRIWGTGHLVKTSRLTATGPYAHLRHPLYAGTLLAVTGLLVCTGWPAAVIWLAIFWVFFFWSYFPYKEGVESDRLEREHGEPYRAYRAAVRPLWPRLSAWRPEGDDTPPARWSMDCFRENNEMGTLLVYSLAVALLVLAAVVRH